MEIESKIVYQILVPYIIGLITIVIPISLNIISSLDTRYKSSWIIGLFRGHRAVFSLIGVIILNIIGLILYIIDIPRIFDFGSFNSFIDHSAFWLFVIICVSSLFIFGWFIWTITMFLDAKRLTIYITRKLKKEYRIIQSCYDSNLYKKLSTNCRNLKRKQKREKYLAALPDLYKTAIDTDTQELMRNMTETIAEFLDTEHLARQKEITKKKTKENKIFDEEIDFSVPLTDCIILSFEKNIAEKPNNFLDFMNSRFFNQFIRKDMAFSGFSMLWKLLKTAINNDKLHVFAEYWMRADSEQDLNSETPNSTLIQKENQTQNKFIAFNLLICSYLLYKKEFTYLTYTFSYSSCSPPEYHLIPSDSTKVMNIYCYFCKEIGRRSNGFIYRFYFEELFDLNKRFSNIDWAKRLCALLFIRLFNIPSNSWRANPLAIPKSPDRSEECELLLNNIKYLQQEIEEIIEEKELLFALQLWERKKATTDYIEDIQKKTTTFFEEYTSQLEKDLEWRRINEAIKNFNKNTLPNIITKLKDEKELFFNHNLVYKKEYFSIYGSKDISERHIINHYLKDEILDKIEKSFSNIAKKCQLKEVLFNNEQEIEKAIKILNPEKHNLLVLISGFTKPENTIERTIFDKKRDKSINIEGNENNIKWMNNFEGRRPYDYSIYILPKEELPNFSIEPFTENAIKEYNLKEAKNDKGIENVYFRVEDLSNPDIQNLNKELTKENYDNLENSIFTYISFIGKYTYNPSTPILCFRVGKNDENNIGKIKEIKNEYLNRVKEEKIKEEPPKQIEGS